MQNERKELRLKILTGRPTERIFFFLLLFQIWRRQFDAFHLFIFYFCCPSFNTFPLRSEVFFFILTEGFFLTFNFETFQFFCSCVWLSHHGSLQGLTGMPYGDNFLFYSRDKQAGNHSDLAPLNASVIHFLCFLIY